METYALVAELPRLRGYARYLARDPAEAEDLVHDTIEKALKAFQQAAKPTSLRAWLFSIMRNRHIDLVRRRNGAAETTSADEAEIEHAVPDVRLEASDFLRDLEGAFSRLPGELKETIWLVSIQGYSYAEVAEVMSVPVGTVRSRVFRARELLREHLKDYFPKLNPEADEND
ncbi:RNA polymerase sigma factor [Parvularcula lutaonensis]|uniref:RNA polymerase sigma factor n=1 Tax=Parvularcula lutaonensis TaxID=491923 RepID=A0ABV7MCF4_9PROT|nr:sigma-70 family RNA polymerase sigma factor [Parvularcula lutaonensis]GGY38395.1 DNA-directed RNA polymerase sigma-70 factor [Parvularcula lutaonensis]